MATYPVTVGGLAEDGYEEVQEAFRRHYRSKPPVRESIPMIGVTGSTVWHRWGRAPGLRNVADEKPLALTYQGSTFAVMMGSPADLVDFAYGFSFAERIIERPCDVEELEIVEMPDGIELRIWLAQAPAQRLATRKRAITGPAGCGLCGVESLAAANVRLTPVQAEAWVSFATVTRSLTAMAHAQVVNSFTHSVHAAGLWDCAAGALVAAREDVGRHNALDKLAGHILQSGLTVGNSAAVLTSRVSIELVQKCARIGLPVMIAMSAPTGLAVRAAHAANITLIGVARQDGFEVFTHPHRVSEHALRSEVEA